MTIDEAVQKVIANQMSLVDACTKLRGTCTVAQFLAALKAAKAKRAARIGVKLFSVALVLVAITAPALAQQSSPPPIIAVPGSPLSPMRLEPSTNGRYIIRDATGHQIGTVEPYVNGWIIRDTTGRETGRVGR